MSVSVYQQHQPTSGATYAKNTVPNLILEANEGVYVKIIYKYPLDDDWEPSNIVFEGTYTPDFSGLITLDFEELYDNYVKTQFPMSDDIMFQDRYWYNFKIIWEGLDSGDTNNVGFRVANAILNSSLAFQSWAGQNFLTNQPIEKPTTKDTPEFLTWFDGTYGDLILKARFYPKSGGHEDVAVFTEDDDDFAEAEAACYTVDVSYSRIIQFSTYLPGQLLGYYDLVLVDGKGSDICSQRYIYRERTGKEKYYLFVNALGGIDTLVCFGEHSLQPELVINVGRFGRNYVPLDDADNVRQWTQQTGQMPYRWRDWLYELMATRQESWKYDGGDYLPIVAQNAEIAMGDSGQLAGASFSYTMAETTRAISDKERAKDRTMHQSTAQQSEPLENMTTETSLAFSQGQGDYETEEVEIPASRVYVTAGGNASISYYINGTYTGSFNPSTDRMPVVIDIDPGDEIQFSSQSEVTDGITINYYPDEEYISIQAQQAAQQQTES